MVRRFALATGLIVLSALACAPKASAQSVTVDASATIPSSCLLSTLTPGVLVYNAAVGRLGSLAGDGGTPATVSINCNGPMNLTISPATLVVKPAAYTGTPTVCAVTVAPTSGTFGNAGYPNSDCTNSSTTNGNFITAAAGTSGTLQVSAYTVPVPVGTLLPQGNYTLRTTLTVAP